ncbi:MAG: lipopolysaccharide biosynthesis protein [Pirellulales bacterium]|nr:lipopolysaccharide biosynthesis protein [Pirellulales bacterium]
MVLIGRYCGEESPGIYALCISIVVFVSVLQDRCLATSYMVFIHKKLPDERGRFLGNTLVHLGLTTLAACVALAGYAGWLAARGARPEMAQAVLLLTVAAPSFLLRDFLRSVAFAHMQMVSALTGDAIVFVIQVGALATLAWTGLLDVPAVFAWMGLATAASCVAWAVAKPLPVALDRGRLAADWREHWGYSRWLVAGRLAGNFSRFAMPWIVVWLADVATVSQLSVCSTLVGISWLFIRGVTNYLRPLTIGAYVQGGAGPMLRVMWQGIGLFVVTLGTIAVALWFVGGWLLATVFKPEYAVAGPALAVLGLGSAITAVGMTVSNALSAVHDTRSQFWGEVITMVVTLATAVPLVHAFGVTGAAWSLLAGAAASLVYMGAALAGDLQRQPQRLA